jgi:hypothetical protein
MSRVISLLWWVVLAVWFATAIAPAVTAMSAFTQLQALPLTVTDYHDYLGDDPQANGRLAAGFVTDPVFRVTDIVQIALAVLAVILFALGGGRPPQGACAAKVVAGIGLAASIALTGVLAIGYGPELNRELEAYRAAALVNDGTAADRHLAAFNRVHPMAERLHGVRALALLVLVAASGFAAAGAPTRRKDPEE